MRDTIYALDTVDQWREDGWCVRVTMLPDGLPFIAQGSASDLAPSPDERLEGTEGHVAVELTWLHDLDGPEGYRQYPTPHGIAPTFEQAVQKCHEALERNARD